MSNIQEIWEPMRFCDYYQISNLGNVRSITRKYSRPHPRNKEKIQTRIVLGRVIKPSKGTNGYLFIKNLKSGMCTIHRAVYEAHILRGKIPDGLVIRHLDGNRLNNNTENLAMGSYKDNLEDSKRHGTWVRNPNRRLSDDSVLEIKSALSRGVPSSQLAKDFSVSKATIYLIKAGKIWCNI